MRILRVIITVIMSMMFGAAAAQNTIEELREQIRRDQQQLEATNALLGKNRDNIRLSERDLKLVQNNIATRRNMVRNLDRQAAIISSEITADTRQINELREQLDGLKKEYGEMVYSAWKSYKLNNAIAFLFASRDFNDATRRISYMKRYNAMREKRGAEIDSLDYILQYELEKLNLRKAELDRSKAQKNTELASLGKEEQQQSATIAGLRTDGRKLEIQAREQQRKIAAAQKNIDRIIAEQAKAGKTGRSQAQIEADIILSGKFEDNKGRLPWPAGGPGSVLDRFGRHAVSSQRDITNNFKGITIAAPRGAQVKAVFEGEVTGVYNMDYFNICVTVRSGDYIVAYANLARASVRTGERVAINQQVGILFDTDDESQHMLVFQIWHKTTAPEPEALNPEQWLRK